MLRHYNGKLTETGLSNGMVHWDSKNLPSRLKKGFGSKIKQISPEEGLNVQRSKRREFDD